MNALDVVQRLLQHRQWATARLRDAARPLTKEQLEQPFPIGQGSVWRTLTHLMAAEYVWLSALQGKTALMPGDTEAALPGNQQGENPIASFAELDTRWDELDARWRDYVATLTPETLESNIDKVSSMSGKTYSTRVLDVLLHVGTHAQYTTAQAVNMLRHLGVEPLPDVMLISLAREESA